MAGDIECRWWPRPQKREVLGRFILRRPDLDSRELETAKEILSEIFRAKPADVEEMIQQRLSERQCR